MRALEIGFVPAVRHERHPHDELECFVLGAGHVVAEPAGAGQPDVVLIACELEREFVQDALAEARAAWADAPVVIVADRATSRTIRAALDCGAAGVVLSASLQAVIEPTLAAVAAGQACVPRGIGEDTESALLSAREKQVLGMVVLGFSNGEIARRLFIADSTVKSHLNSVFRKLGVRSRQEATALILDPIHGLGPGILTITTT